MSKILASLAAMLLVAIIAKLFLLPFIPNLAISELRALKTRELLLLLEVIAVAVILASFVIDELLEKLSRMQPGRLHESNPMSRWQDAAFVLATAFGSALLFIGVARLAD